MLTLRVLAIAIAAVTWIILAFRARILLPARREILAWIGLALRGRIPVAHPHRAPLVLLVLLAALAAGLTLQSLAPNRAHPSMVHVASWISFIVATSCWQLFMMHLRHGHPWPPEPTPAPRPRRHVIVLVIAASAIVLVVVASALPNPYAQLARFADLFYLLLCLPHIAWYSHLAARVQPAPLTRAAHRLVALSCAVAAACLTWPLATIVTHSITGDPPQPTPLAVTTTTDAATLAAVIGLTIPEWGPRFRLDWPWQWIARERTYWQLARLWRHLTTAYPRFRFEHVPVTHRRDLLHRRVVEITDAMAVLREHLDPRDAHRAETLTAQAHRDRETRQVVMQAATIAAALECRTVQRPPEHAQRCLVLERGTLHDDALYLAKVSKQYARSAVVRQVRTEVRDAVQRGERGPHVERHASIGTRHAEQM